MWYKPVAHLVIVFHLGIIIIILLILNWTIICITHEYTKELHRVNLTTYIREGVFELHPIAIY